MIAMTIIPDVETTGFPAIRDRQGEVFDIIHLGGETTIEIGGLDNATANGKPSMAFCFPLPNGDVVVAETTLALFLTAADALKARYGDPR